MYLFPRELSEHLKHGGRHYLFRGLDGSLRHIATDGLYPQALCDADRIVALAKRCRESDNCIRSILTAIHLATARNESTACGGEGDSLGLDEFLERRLEGPSIPGSYVLLPIGMKYQHNSNMSGRHERNTKPRPNRLAHDP